MSGGGEHEPFVLQEGVEDVQLDGDLIQLLRAELAPFDNVEIIHGDILSLLAPGHPQSPIPNLQWPVAPGQSPASTYKVVANIPYYITAPILRRLLESRPRPSVLVLTVQAEVAERICAGPGQMSVLAVSVQFYGLPEIVAGLPAGAFYPPPQVDSAVVRITVRDTWAAPVPDVDQFFRVVQAGFSQKRKQLKNSLAGGLRLAPAEVLAALLAVGVEPTRRAETLSLEEWGQVNKALAGAEAEHDR